MATYLIQYRFEGQAKRRFRVMADDINRRFRLGRQKRIVPHMTLVGPFSTNYENLLVQDFKRISTDQPVIELTLNGFEAFEGKKEIKRFLWFRIHRSNHVMALHIERNLALETYRKQLVGKLKPFCNLSKYDSLDEAKFHCTIGMYIPEEKRDQVNDYLSKEYKPRFRQILTRVTLLRGQRILAEYDFFLHRLLSRREALNRRIRNETRRLRDSYLKAREKSL